MGVAMTQAADVPDPEPKKPSRLPLVLGLILALVGGGGTFFAVYSGLLLSQTTGAEEQAEVEKPDAPLPDVVFVPIEPIVVSLTNGGSSNYLRFRAQLEVPREYAKDVEHILPRIVDVLNGYLRALEPGDIEAPDALVRLRAQMLRRVQIVTGKTRIRDLLVMEYVLN